MATSSNQQDSEQRHRRETILYLIVPMIGAGVIVLAGGVMTMLLPRRQQVTTLSDWVLTIVVLCPSVVCLFAICLILIVAVASMNKLHSMAAKPLTRLEDVSETMVERTSQATDSINEKTVDFGARFAFLDRILSAFDPPSENGDDKHV
jgi:hypothetical protein